MKLLTIDEAVKELRQGGLVVVPTETVYGLAADGTNERAIKAIFDIKGRPVSNPIMLLVADLEMAEKVALTIPVKARRLMEAFWPGPLTIVLRKQSWISDILSAGSVTIGIRMPESSITLEIIKRIGRPLAVPSANRSGEPAPRTLAEVERALKGLEIAGVVDGEKCALGLPSTVVDLTGPQIKILRKGPISDVQMLQVI